MKTKKPKMEKVSAEDLIGKRILVGFQLNEYADPSSAFEADMIGAVGPMLEMNVHMEEDGEVRHVYRDAEIVHVYSVLGDAEDKEPKSRTKVARIELMDPGEPEETHQVDRMEELLVELSERGRSNTEKLGELAQKQETMEKQLKTLWDAARNKGLIL